MRDMDDLFAALSKSKFRSRFSLSGRELAYFRGKGPEVMKSHARDFVRQRLGPAYPAGDGRQTPLKNHPVFIAQHATGTCCRKCLEKWHHIPQGQPLDDEQIEYILEVIMHWLAHYED